MFVDTASSSLFQTLEHFRAVITARKVEEAAAIWIRELYNREERASSFARASKMVVLIRKRFKPAQQQQRRLMWVGGVLTLVALSMLGISFAYLYTPHRISPCRLVGDLCVISNDPSPPPPLRKFTDEEVASRAVAKDILSQPKTYQGGTPKIAFMFLTPGPIPFEFIWEAFFKGHEGLYSIYVHASERATLKSIWRSRLFQDREIPSSKVYWGRIEMIDAERRLLARALLDLNNQFFVLLSESCIPLRDFTYVYSSLMNSSFSFVDNFDDPGPHGLGRYIQEKMTPEVQPYDWRKGAQWFAVLRRHALLLVSDYLYYMKFKDHCQPGEENHNCYPDEHYVQTYLHMVDPGGLSNWTVTHVDWSEGGWHPRSYGEKDITVELLQRLQSVDEHVHVTSDAAATVTTVPCLWDGVHRPCFLFARKFLAESAEALADVLPQVTRTATSDGIQVRKIEVTHRPQPVRLGIRRTRIAYTDDVVVELTRKTAREFDAAGPGSEPGLKDDTFSNYQEDCLGVLL